MIIFIKQKVTQRANLWWLRGRMGEEIITEFGMNMFTLLYLKWITNKDLLYSTGNPAQCYMAAWMGAELWGEWIHVYIRLSPFNIHLNLSQHCLLIS